MPMYWQCQNQKLTLTVNEWMTRSHIEKSGSPNESEKRVGDPDYLLSDHQGEKVTSQHFDENGKTQLRKSFKEWQMVFLRTESSNHLKLLKNFSKNVVFVESSDGEWDHPDSKIRIPQQWENPDTSLVTMLVCVCICISFFHNLKCTCENCEIYLNLMRSASVDCPNCKSVFFKIKIYLYMLKFFFSVRNCKL